MKAWEGKWRNGSWSPQHGPHTPASCDPSLDWKGGAIPQAGVVPQRLSLLHTQHLPQRSVHPGERPAAGIMPALTPHPPKEQEQVSSAAAACLSLGPDSKSSPAHDFSFLFSSPSSGSLLPHLSVIAFCSFVK